VDCFVYYPGKVYHKKEERAPVNWCAFCCEPKGPSDLNSTKPPRIPGLGRLAAENPEAAEPAAVEPAPVRDPATVAPADVVDALGVVRVPIVGKDEDDLAAEDGRDLVLVLEDVLAVLLPLVGAHLLRAGDHDVSLDARLAPEKREDVVGDAAQGHGGRETGRDESIAELLDFPGVRRVDQGPPSRFAELLLEVCHCTEVAHGGFLSPFFQRAHSLPTWQRGSAGLPAFF